MALCSYANSGDNGELLQNQAYLVYTWYHSMRYVLVRAFFRSVPFAKTHRVATGVPSERALIDLNKKTPSATNIKVHYCTTQPFIFFTCMYEVPGNIFVNYPILSACQLLPVDALLSSYYYCTTEGGEKRTLCIICMNES